MPQKRYSILIIVMILLSSCNPRQQNSTPISTTVSSVTPIALTATPIPDRTKVWVILGGELPEQSIRSIVEKADSLTKSAGLVLEQKPQFNADELASKSAEIKAIVILPPDPGVQQLSIQYPEIAFVPIGIEGLTAAQNLYVTTNSKRHPEWEGFLGGFVSALVTSEWRIGMITLAGSDDGAKAADGFVNGGVFYCGLCNPLYPPFVDYPYTLSLSANAPQSEWQSVADDLIKSGVSTVYVYPEVAVPDLLAYLGQNGLRIISGDPVIEPLRPAYLATIQQTSDIAFSSAIQDAISGKPAGIYSGQLMVVPIDNSLLTEGKMRIVNQIIGDLMNGTIEATSVIQ